MTSVRPRLPDFYVAGPPRCGTTTLYEVLRRHDGIFLPAVKEPKYWCDDLDSGSVADGLIFTRSFDDYVRLFAGAAPEHLAGDLSPWYLYSSRAIARIADASPGARFIVGVRNPVDLIESLHAQRLASSYEDLPDLREALAAEPDRAQGRRLPRHVRNIPGLLYTRVASLGDQLERLRRLVPDDRIHVYVFDDFREQPLSVVNGMLAFLGLHPLGDDRPIEVINARPRVTHRALRNAFTGSSKVTWARRLVPPIVRRPVRAAIDRVTLSRTPTGSPLTASERQELLARFRPDIERTSRIVGRDLWALWST